MTSLLCLTPRRYQYIKSCSARTLFFQPSPPPSSPRATSPVPPPFPFPQNVSKQNAFLFAWRKHSYRR